jgi:hypothetical protein
MVVQKKVNGITIQLGCRDVAIGGVWGGVGGVTPPIIQTLVKVGQNGTDNCLKLKVKLGKICESLVKVWDKRLSKLLKVMKLLAILTILKLLLCLR